MSPEEKIRAVLAVLLAGCTVQVLGLRFRFYSKGTRVPNMFEYYAIPESGVYVLNRCSSIRAVSGSFEFDAVQAFPFRMNDFFNAISELDETLINDRSKWALTGDAAFLAPPADFEPAKDSKQRPKPSQEVL
jgi:hypothetical protein